MWWVSDFTNNLKFPFSTEEEALEAAEWLTNSGSDVSVWEWEGNEQA